MTVWSIGCAGLVPSELARVTAETPDARVTGVHDAGDGLGYVVALNAVADALAAGEKPTPLTVAITVAGRGATVHEVLPDGTLRGWRRDYGDASLTPSAS